jgi:hypothetical protein
MLGPTVRTPLSLAHTTPPIESVPAKRHGAFWRAVVLRIDDETEATDTISIRGNKDGTLFGAGPRLPLGIAITSVNCTLPMIVSQGSGFFA